ncbi:poly(A) RNA polymerase, mitochondrial isoform X5 [Halictus rubicundus]|uniref:poly(A) RNA polymerase, mitochondrial isoform X5 n=1 Tax=Halictus rubicundus TaxID=77578 RepID=UPI004036FB23
MMSKLCELCSMEFQDEYALQGHLGGKKHLQKVQQAKLIDKSNVASKQCELCSMEFQDDYALQGHLGGKKHLQKVHLKEGLEKSIFVPSLPKFIPRPVLIEFFQQYGAIKWYKFIENYLLIEFVESCSAEAVLRNPVWINKVRLNVKRRIVHNDSRIPKLKKENNPIENTGPINYYNIQHIFEEKTTFDEQLATFLNAIQLTNAEIETRYESVCTHLDKTFKAVFPKCKTYKFGSTQMGLGFKECDLDIYIDIGEPISESTNDSTANTWTMQKIFKEVKKMMFRMNQIFSNIIVISKAKIPIIKFCYVKTNIFCDISFKNSLGIYKSKLIKHCISLDCRLRPLMMLIKYWAKNFKLSYSGKLSNYALALLIIFYLQQPSVKIIPPLLEFQENFQPHIINGWQVNFNENTKLPPITNTNSIPQLLYGFFIFYSTFTFKSQIICPLDGMVHTESEFKDVENLPQHMNRYKACLKEDENFMLKVNRDMCVQDPVELNHNVTANTPHSTLDAFVHYCTIGAAVCSETSKNDYKDLLKLLLSTVIKRNSTRHTFQVTISDNQQECINVTKKPKLTENDWHFAVFNILTQIFEKVFRVQVIALISDVEAKQQKIEVLSDVHTENYKKIIFHCVGSLCTWNNRKISNIVLDPSISCLEKEALITNEIIKEHEKEKSTNKINLDFMCTFEKKVDPLKVILTVSNRNTAESIFQEFSYFAVRKIHEIVRQTLIHMQQFNKCC